MWNESDFIKSSELQGHFPAPLPPPTHLRHTSLTSPFRSWCSRPDFLLTLISLSLSKSYQQLCSALRANLLGKENQLNARRWDFTIRCKEKGRKRRGCGTPFSTTPHPSRRALLSTAAQGSTAGPLAHLGAAWSTDQPPGRLIRKLPLKQPNI